MDDIKEIKAKILALATKYKGQGDPDFTKQHALEVLIKRLLYLAPQRRLKDRLAMISGPWYQVWGAYDYRHGGSRSVDPTIDADRIYQVISPKGYYYNITLLKDKNTSKKVRVGLLRGEYENDPETADGLMVHFTAYPGTLLPKNDNTPLWKLAELAEEKKLPEPIKIVPTWIVNLFFKGGKLEEIYTDADLRIAYGSRYNDGAGRQLFVMTRAD